MKLVFIGFGEAAYNIAAGLKSEGLDEMGAFDVCAREPVRGRVIRERAKELGVVLFEDLSEACKKGEIIFSLTSAKVAVSVAKEAFQYLEKKQIYIDMNSAAPTVKEQIETLPRAAGVLFCDAGVMGTVPGNQHKVPMFLSGDGAVAFSEKFAPLGMNLKVLAVPAGGASAIKMFKSVVMKGLPQLMFESFEGAQKYGVLDILVESLSGSLEGKSIQKLANTFIARTLIHAERRSAEMKDVVKTLEALDVNAAMSKATVAKLDQMAGQDWMNLLGEGASSLGYQDAMKKYMDLK